MAEIFPTDSMDRDVYEGQSKVGTVREVSAVVEAANRVRHAARPIVLLVTLV